MNILIFSPFLPWPLTSGGKIRIFNILKQLSLRHNITLACLDENDVTDYGDLKDYCSEIICITKKPNPTRDLIRFLAGSEPYNFIRFRSDVFRNAIKNLLSRNNFDLVQIELSLMWQYADLFHNIPIILNTQNIEYEIVKQIGATSRNPIRKLLYSIETYKLRRGEERAWRECALCLAVSEGEQNSIAACVDDDSKVMTIPNGVDLEKFTFFHEPAAKKQLLFLGGMDYLPNSDAAHYFLKDIFPLIQAIEPDVILDFVGRNFHALRKRFSGSGVRFNENVPQVIPWFRQVALLVVPLRMGAGSRLKILEAMAAGVPIVSTSKGCEGIAVENGRHVLVADSPDEFSNAVIRVLNDKGLAKKLATTARLLVEERYSWEKIIQPLEKALVNLG